MKHHGRVSKVRPAMAETDVPYLVPRNIFEISSWTDIIVVISLSIEWLSGVLGIPWLDWVGQWVPTDLRRF